MVRVQCPPMRAAATISLALLLASLAPAQDKPTPKSATGAAPIRVFARPKLSKEQELRVTKLLKCAEAGAATLDPASRIIAYTELARISEFRDHDKAKPLDLLDTALNACRDLQPEMANADWNREVKTNLEMRVMQEMVSIAPERLDARVFDLSPDMRRTAAGLLVDYYTSHKLLDRAYDVVMRVAGDGEMPYATAIKLMQALKDRPDQLRSLFVSSMESYENNGGQREFRMAQGFPEMIVEFHDRLSNQIVMQAIDDVLKQAKAHDESEQRKMNYSMSSQKGAVQFHSTYEFRLFQLAPILKQIDAGRAQLLLKDNEDVNTQLKKYPEGTSALVTNKDHPELGMSMSMTTDSGGKPGAGYNGPSPIELERFQQVQADARKRPQDALANAALLRPDLAIGAYESIAANNVSADPSIARSALSKAGDLMEKTPNDKDTALFEGLVGIYRQLGDTDNAKKAVEKWMDASDRLYKKDTDADDPNVAPKAYWPSTKSYRSLLKAAQELDPAWAESLLNGIQDDSIRVFLEITMVDTMLGAQQMPFMTTMYSPKSGKDSFFVMGLN
jgi:hypothetical protein